MTVTRPIQGSLLPDHQPDRPTGPVLGSVQTGTNADLIARIAPIYLEGRTVIDVTYGRGKWWDRWRPEALVAHDLAVDGVDFRGLPETSSSVDVVCFDPPYIPAGGQRTSHVTRDERDYRDRFGLAPRSRADIVDLFVTGIAEAARVARQWVLAKCTDYVDGGTFHLGHLDMIDAGRAAGLQVHDLIVHHTGSGPGGHNITTVLRARRHHSYLIVFRAAP